MAATESSEQETLLAELCKEIVAIEKKLGGNLDGPDYVTTWRRLHELKEKYKQLTGIYPNLPASG